MFVANRESVQAPDRTLTQAEMAVIRGIYRGRKNCEISDILGVTEHVIKNYIRHILDKLGLDSRLQVALWFTKRLHDEHNLHEED